MKKFIALTLMSALALSCIGCGNNAEMERLKKENEELKEELNGFKNSTELPNATSEKDISSSLELVSQQKIDNEYNNTDYVGVNFVIKNNTEKDINTITLNISELDSDGNIISTTHPQESATVTPNQTITINSLSKNDVYAVQLDSYSYYTDNENYIQGNFPKNIEKLILK